MREIDPYELVVRWYLRFNGYLGVENFVVHKQVKGGIGQGGETDVLAVRFPHSRELPGFVIENDPKLLDKDAVRDGLVDFVVAEVKGGRTDSLNRVWRPPVDEIKIDCVSYLLRWLGPLADETEIQDAAKELQASHRIRCGGVIFRLIVFTHAVRPRLRITQVTFRDIAHFLVHVRAPSWQDRGIGSRSPHDQWHPIIKDLWKLADPQAPLGADDKIHAILKYLRKPLFQSKAPVEPPNNALERTVPVVMRRTMGRPRSTRSVKTPSHPVGGTRK